MITDAKFIEITVSYLTFIIFSLLVSFGRDVRWPKRSVQTKDERKLLKEEVEENEEVYDGINVTGIPLNSFGGQEFMNMITSSTVDGIEMTTIE
jgi:hypothetical protein